MKVNLLKDGFRLLWIIELILYFAIPFGITSLQRICYYLFYVINFTLFMYIVINFSLNRLKLTRKMFYSFLLVILIIISLFISCIMNPTTFSLDVHFSAIMNYLSLVFSIFYVNFIDLDANFKKFILRINIFIAILFCILSVSPYAYTHEKLTESLNLGYSNPNATAIYIFLTIAVIFSFFNYVKLKKIKIFMLFLLGYLIYLVYLTESRTCMIVSILLVIYFIWPFKFSITRKWIIVGLVIPIFFLFGYTYLYNNGYFIDLQIMGKSFYSGREVYYIGVLNDIKNSLFFGDFGFYHLTNTHNGPLSVLSSLGIVGLILLYIFIYKSFTQLLINQSKITKIALVSIIILFAQSSSEAAILVGGANFTVPMATLFLIAKTKFD